MKPSARLLDRLAFTTDRIAKLTHRAHPFAVRPVSTGDAPE